MSEIPSPDLTAAAAAVPALSVRAPPHTSGAASNALPSAPRRAGRGLSPADERDEEGDGDDEEEGGEGDGSPPTTLQALRPGAAPAVHHTPRQLSPTAVAAMPAHQPSATDGATAPGVASHAAAIGPVATASTATTTAAPPLASRPSFAAVTTTVATTPLHSNSGRVPTAAAAAGVAGLTPAQQLLALATAAAARAVEVRLGGAAAATAGSAPPAATPTAAASKQPQAGASTPSAGTDVAAATEATSPRAANSDDDDVPRAVATAAAATGAAPAVSTASPTQTASGSGVAQSSTQGGGTAAQPPATADDESDVESEDDELDSGDVLRPLYAGATFKKFGRWGAPHARFVQLTADGTRLTWRAPGGGRAREGLAVADLVAVHEKAGCTAIARRGANMRSVGRADCAFSAETTKRSLDLEASSPGERATWVAGLRRLMQMRTAGAR